MPLVLGGTTISVQEVSTGSNNTIIKNSAVSNEIVVDETSAELLASDDKTLTDVNIVNYNLSTGATTFEYFNMYSFEAKNSNSSNSVNELSLNSSIGNAVGEVNMPDYEVHRLGDTDIYYVNGYTPLSAASEEIKDEEAESPDAIIGTEDSRTQVTNTKISPYLKVAYMKATYDNVYDYSENTYRSLYIYSTAFMIGKNIVSTAGHCLYQDVTNLGDYDDGIDNPRFPDKVEFYFGASNFLDATESYQYYAEGEVLHIEYSYYVSPDFEHDWAVIELDRNLGNTTGWFGRVMNWDVMSIPIKTCGYPSDKLPGTMWEMTGSFYSKTDYRYYTNDIDTMGGQSGSPYLIDYSGLTNFVCGIHTFADSSETPAYNGGTVLNEFIFYYMNSFTSSRNEDSEYEYPIVSIFMKSGSKWFIWVENTSSAGINLEYNSKMCFLNDAKNWSGLNDVVSIYIAPYALNIMTISENVFATSITCSYVRGGERIITYANNLNADGTLTSYNNVISA